MPITGPRIEGTYPEYPSFVQPVHADNLNRYERVRNAENASRLAFCMGSFDTTGWGEFQMPEAFRFDCMFVGEPYIFSGYACHGQALVGTRFPRVSAGVREWHFDNRGLYYAAHLVFTVETRSPEDVVNQVEEIPLYTLRHSFCFAGVAIKNLSTASNAG